MEYNLELPNLLNERIFEKIKKKYLLFQNPSSNPKGIILGGQPGSGKSYLSNEVRDEFKEDFIFISTDDLRPYHPAYSALQQNPATIQNAANLVNPYASAWTERLIEYCIINKYNLIIDSTLGGNTEAVFRTIDMYKNNGYQVHIRVMAVPAIVSRLSIFLRYETQLAEKGFARWTRMEDHDDRFKKLESVLEQIITLKQIDSCKFYERVLRENGTIELKVFIFRKNLSLFKLCRKTLDTQTLKYIKNTIDKIRILIQKRNGDMSEFDKYVG
jgi:adenylate kinase family enzyme